MCDETKDEDFVSGAKHGTKDSFGTSGDFHRQRDVRIFDARVKFNMTPNGERKKRGSSPFLASVICVKTQIGRGGGWWCWVGGEEVAG